MKRNQRKPQLSEVAANKTAKTRNQKAQTKNRVRAFLNSPVLNVCALVLLLVAVFAGLRYFNARKPAAQISFVETEGVGEENAEQTETTGRRLPVVFSGEVYGTALRLREAGALGMAMTLTIFDEARETGSLPADGNQVLNDVAAKKLMPPGLKFENNQLISESSQFFVRYQQSPFQFEILSKPGKTIHGPALMLRFPLASLDERTITYFQSSSVSGFQLPAAFAPLDEIVAAGWTIEQWRGEILPDDKQNLALLAEEKRLLEQLAKNQ